MRFQHLCGCAAVILVAIIGWSASAAAQEEFPPPQGKGRVVVVASGLLGANAYRPITREIAKLGYDAVLFDGTTMEGSRGQVLRTDIQKAMQMPHALPGKVGLVGFSAGGGIALFWASPWTDLVAVDVDWYPATSVITDVKGFARRLQVPVLMFAGEDDTFRNCCLIGKAHELADAAKGHDFQLITYPGAKHDFILQGRDYNATAYRDAMQRMAAILKQYLGN